MKRKSYITILFLILLLSIVCCFPVYANAKRSLNKTSISLKVNQKYKLRLSNAKTKEIKWISSNPKIVSVKNGMICAKKIGTCKISAMYKDKKYNCSVRVTNGKVTLTVQSFDKDSQILAWRLKNNSDTIVNIGEEFALKIFQDNQWVPVDFLEGTAFRAIAMVVEPTKSAEISVNLNEYCPKLEAGKYRISYDLGDRGVLSAEFTVE